MVASLLDLDIEAWSSTLTSIRHDLHRHPELGFEEKRTQGVVRDWLVEHGYQPRECAETGLVADLKPELASRGSIALRADLDCLPIHEHTDLPYRSLHEGRSHKCGHDGHTVILMGVARALAERRDQIAKNVRLLFQPAEEGVRGGGAHVMIAQGALDGVREIYGLHNWPGYPKGTVRVVPGPIMAQVHRMDIEILGVGGHGSQPHLCRDPIVAGSQLVSALQTIVARDLSHRGGAVVSLGQFHAGTTDNVIPARAFLQGTIRTFDDDVTKRVLRRIREVATGIATSSGVTINLDLVEGYPLLVNHPECAEAVARVAQKIVGPQMISTDELPMAGGEDFAHYCKRVPGAYFFLGAKRSGEETPVCHHPDFDFDDDLIPLGMRMFLGLVEDRMGAGASMESGVPAGT